MRCKNDLREFEPLDKYQVFCRPECSAAFRRRRSFEFNSLVERRWYFHFKYYKKWGQVVNGVFDYLGVFDIEEHQ